MAHILRFLNSKREKKEANDKNNETFILSKKVLTQLFFSLEDDTEETKIWSSSSKVPLLTTGPSTHQLIMYANAGDPRIRTETGFFSFAKAIKILVD